MMRARAAFPLSVAALLLACASSGGPNANRSRFEREVGVATYNEGRDLVLRVLLRYQFIVERETDPPAFYVETRWRNRTPFDDERALGISNAQVRAIVRGNIRNTTSMQGDLYSVNLTIENRVQTRNSVDWSTGTATAEYREWAQTVTDDLRRELDVGVRSFGTGF